MGLPVLIGAGVGGLTSALRGKNILKGAALGGALGGVGGGIDGLLKGGSFLEGTAMAMGLVDNNMSKPPQGDVWFAPPTAK